MLGSMFMTSNRGTENENTYNVGARLLEMGMARLMSYSAERSPYRKELERASETARESCLGIWKFQTEESEVEASHKNEDEFDMESSESVEVKISEVVNGNTFYVHRISDLKSLEMLGNQMESNVSLFEKEYQDFKPQRGTWYSYSSVWYSSFICVMSLKS